MIKRLFKAHVNVVRAGSILSPVIFLGTGLLFFTYPELKWYHIVEGVMCILAAIVNFPHLLISLGLLKNNGLTSKLIDLSEFDFNTGLASVDFHVNEKSASKVDDLMKFKVNQAEGIVNTFKIAKELAEMYKFDSNEYMYALMRAADSLGQAHQLSKRPDAPVTFGDKPTDSIVKAEKLQKQLRDIKEKLQKNPKPPDPFKDTEGENKYDFL